jgi:SagB-type dehydrogenase family enzyme
MKTTTKAAGIIAAGFFFIASAFAEEIKKIELPAPDQAGGKPLMQALKARRSEREFAPDALSPQVLSNLLWAAGGVNRSDSGRRTNPTAHDAREIEIYVALAEGLFLYDPAAHQLKAVLAQDIRGATGGQPFVAAAPVNLVFVADYAKMERMPKEDQDFYSATDAGFVSQNVYLFCASEGLNTVVRGWLERPALAKAMKLRAEQKIVLAQTVGYPRSQKAGGGSQK